jgi:hypothetical protein
MGRFSCLPYYDILYEYDDGVRPGWAGVEGAAQRATPAVNDQVADWPIVVMSAEILDRYWSKDTISQVNRPRAYCSRAGQPQALGVQAPIMAWSIRPA